MDGMIHLISVIQTKNKYGVDVAEEAKRKVFCDVSSIYGNEFHNAGQNGIKPELKFKVFPYDYHDEKIVEYDGKRYSIYRTYRRNTDYLELYAERKTGDV